MARDDTSDSVDDLHAAAGTGQASLLEQAGLAEEFTARRDEVLSRRATLDTLQPDEDGYAAAADAVLAATAALVDCGATVPARIRAQEHRRTTAVLRSAAGAATLVLLVAAGLALLGVYSRWWLLLLGLLLLVTWSVPGFHSETNGADRTGSRWAYAALVVLGAVTILTALMMTGVLGAWWSLLAVPGCLAVFFLALAGEPADTSSTGGTEYAA